MIFDATKPKHKFKERVLEIVESRAPTAVPDSAPGEPRPAAPVLNIKDALQKSLDEVRKPPQTEPGGRPPRRKHKRRAR